MKPESSSKPTRVRPRRSANPTKVWLPLTPTGGLDLAALGPRRERLRAWLSDPAVMRELGLTPAAPAEAEEPEFPFSEAEASALWRALGELQAWIARRAFRLDPELAGLLRFSDAERALLAGPTVRVLAKYAPGWLGEHKDEVGLALLVIAIEQAKISRIRMMRERKAEAPEAPPAPAPEATPEPEKVQTAA